MEYFNAKITERSFDEAIERLADLLEEEGLGVLTEIDVQENLKKKMEVDFKKYRILGACNPELAHKALTAEDKIGVMLPCNVIVEEHEVGQVEVSAVNLKASMQAVKNEGLKSIGAEVEARLKKIVDQF